MHSSCRLVDDEPTSLGGRTQVDHLSFLPEARTPGGEPFGVFPSGSVERLVAEPEELRALTGPLACRLDAIIAVGYRVRSDRGMQFRRWATERLREYLVKGFTMDERRMYMRVREIFALAGDYDSASKQTLEFFQMVQNKLHHAAWRLTRSAITFTSRSTMGVA
ncbi:MAG: hypothetical protein EA382_01320 [Spirochaetaceae bacterium]|nr:MAG: hypothetical protein EA382_01320 [Spirochaetaceae bacterium]